MTNYLVKRTSRRPMSTLNRDRALARIERELTTLILASPICTSLEKRGDARAVDALTTNTLPHWYMAAQNIRLLWP